MDIEKQIEGLKKTCWGVSAHVVDDERRNAATALSTLQPSNEPLTPCDLCLYDPPSSFGGKPCSICPAVRRTSEGEGI